MKILFTLLFSVYTLVAVAQKVDLDRYSFVMMYRDLPQKPLDPAFRTYQVNVSGTRNIRTTFSDNELADATPIEGWRRIDNGPAHVIIRPMFEDVIIEKSEVKERVDIQKDKDGKETGRKYYYKLQLEYSFAARADVSDFRGQPIVRPTLAQRYSKKTWTSQEYNSYAAANNYLTNNREEIKNRFLRDEVMLALQNLSGTLTNDYGFPVRKADDHFWVLDSKKHPEYDSYQRAHQDIKAILGAVSPDEPLTEAIERLRAPMEYYEGLPKRYTGNDKADAKLRYSAYYNLAKLYLYLDDPEKTKQYADLLSRNGYDASDGSWLNGKANDLMDLFRRNGARTRHFAIDYANLRQPE
ncbi:hypothetical protein [Arsenicibacter rosenii]|nr:hypothetical protein [Arsenicibacter rosenii]